jgi:TetR/AcrR family transcriptional regulator, transcriptional repressor for nem operon
MARPKMFDERATLDRALTWFWIHGYDGTSVQDLIDHLGISRSSLYGTYGEKRGLFITSLERYIASSSEFYTAKLAAKGKGLALIEQVFDEKWNTQQRYRDRRGCFVANTTAELAMHDKGIARLVKKNAEHVQASFAELVARGKRDGSVKKHVDPAQAGAFLFTTLTGLEVSVRGGLTPEGYRSVKKLSLAALAG